MCSGFKAARQQTQKHPYITVEAYRTYPDETKGQPQQQPQPQQMTNEERINAALAKNEEDLRDSDVYFQLPQEGLVNDPQNHGNLYDRPFVDNPDGSTSTIYSTQFEDEKGSHIVSGVWDNRVHTADEAIRRYYAVGDNGLLTYETREQAEKADKLIHLREVNRLRHRGKPEELKQYAYSLQQADHPERFDENGNYKGGK